MMSLSRCPWMAIHLKERFFFKGPGMTSQVIEVLVDSQTIGQYVRLRIIQGTRNILHFEEFDIYTLE